MPRLILDVSATSRWLGAAVGIIRVEHELAAYAATHRPDITLALFDPASASFRPLAPCWRDTVIGWRGAVDMSGRGLGARRGWRRFMPSRYPIVMRLERWRRRLGAGTLCARLIDRLQRVLLSLRHHSTPLGDAQGRYDFIDFDQAVGAPLILTAADTLLTVGAHREPEQSAALAALLRESGCALVAMCHDLIPLLLPECFPAADVAAFRHYWAGLLPVCDTVLVTSAAVERDLQAHCGREGIAPRVVRVPLGYAPPVVRAGAPLPAGLEPGRFALFVGTIEPRKGHATLIAAWRRLLARGVPQEHRFRLVFVGRAGWQVEAVLRTLADPAQFAGTVLHLPAVDDAGLATLHREAAFCLYPSLYEGFGLPIVEAFAYGQPVIASTGGAVPEIAGEFCPCLDPHDVAAWAERIEAWMADPAQPAAIAARLRAGFRHPDWATAAATILQTALPAQPGTGLDGGAVRTLGA